ncbi:uncharacterized protein TNIN_449871 [Trichonephila inaurata madagascariensis]|uniref:Uncharacterized protein n=1 Tax=Trichonephila inaurata madagascariensis TaxID=2747483 RepID=A0A8X6YT32_9ARAC|nr:uncharacterized protein TNIN_449871 [Trichonephila inaurata madagascariensis]
MNYNILLLQEWFWSHCGCRKLGLQCSSDCGQCNGQACFNASRHKSDLHEDCTFDPKILQDLETNILDNENDENELEIFDNEDNEEEEEAKN